MASLCSKLRWLCEGFSSAEDSIGNTKKEDRTIGNVYPGKEGGNLKVCFANLRPTHDDEASHFYFFQ